MAWEQALSLFLYNIKPKKQTRKYNAWPKVMWPVEYWLWCINNQIAANVTKDQNKFT